MNCPKCADGVLETATVAGIAVDRCPRCRGIWFDPAELGALLKLDAADLKPLAGRPGTDPGLNARPGRCPRDGARLLRVVSARKRSVTLDTCPQCRGLWLDGGELAALLAR
jgi:Zn-finger nucleic acid-binding protein